jgi:hypothetical protein
MHGSLRVLTVSSVHVLPSLNVGNKQCHVVQRFCTSVLLIDVGREPFGTAAALYQPLLSYGSCWAFKSCQ